MGPERLAPRVGQIAERVQRVRHAIEGSPGTSGVALRTTAPVARRAAAARGIVGVEVVAFEGDEKGAGASCRVSVEMLVYTVSEEGPGKSRAARTLRSVHLIPRPLLPDP